MLRRYRWVVIGGLVCMAGLLLFASLKPDSNAVSMGDGGSDTALIAWVGLATSVFGFFTALVSLIKEIATSKKD